MRGRAWVPIAVLIILALSPPAFSLEYAYRCSDAISFAFRGDAKPHIVCEPKVAVTSEEMEDLYNGGIVTRMLDAEDGLKIGWMRFFLDADPVTAWAVVCDVEHFSMVDEDFPASGPLGDRRRTFMPYTFDSKPCVVEGRRYLYELLVMPVVSPRKFTVLRCHNRDGFPWESGWKAVPELHCTDDRPPEFESYFEKAVHITRNTGAWRISVLPPEMRRSPADIRRTDVTYFVDTDPGGNVGKIKALANAAQKSALPKLAELLRFHAPRWQEHMKRHHGGDQRLEFNRLLREYLETWRPLFPAAEPISP